MLYEYLQDYKYRMIKFDLIQAFMVVVETNSFNVAAKKLDKSTAAISQKINALEKHLNVSLIKRDTRNMEITPIGHAYYNQCRKIFSEIERADKLIKTQHEEPHGKLKVACPLKSLVPKIAQFKNLYPDIELEIDSNEKWPNVQKSKIDIIVGITLPAPQDYVCKKIGTVRYTLCASKAYFKKYGKPESPHDLIHHHYIAHTKRLNDNQLSFNKGALIVPVAPWLRLNNTLAMLECAIHDLGLVSLHNVVTQEALKNGQLIEIFDSMQCDEPLNVYYPYHEYLDPKIKCFLNYINETFVN